MTIVQLASKIAKLEGKKSQARIGDIREILTILADINAQEVYEENHRDSFRLLEELGAKRFEKKQRSKK